MKNILQCLSLSVSSCSKVKPIFDSGREGGDEVEEWRDVEDEQCDDGIAEDIKGQVHASRSLPQNDGSDMWDEGLIDEQVEDGGDKKNERGGKAPIG